MQAQASHDQLKPKNNTGMDHPTSRHSSKARPSPIFIYSGFRASSTWLWSKFRAHGDLLCYYEPFNEQLLGLTLDNIGEARPDGWRSHHPNGAPYALEYAGMLTEHAGVPGFPAAQNLGERYIGTAGAEGPLDPDIADYVQGLIRHAHERDRVPLLACTRMLGKAHGLREAFGGYHILLIRNLFHQWNSYAGQARFGNWYFLQSLYETRAMAEKDPAIARLVRFFPEKTCSSLEAWVARDNFDRVFCYFVGFHLYFLTLARRSADLVVDANALASPDPAYRRGIAARIIHDTGVELDMEDASERVDFPLHAIAAGSACKIIIDEISAEIKSSCSANVEEQAFIDDLVADLWREQALFQRQTAGAVEYLGQVEAKLHGVEEELLRHTQAATLEREAFAQALEATRQELTGVKEDSQKESVDAYTRLAEQGLALRDAQDDVVRAREIATQRESAAAQEAEKHASQFAAKAQELAAANDALTQTRQRLELSRIEMEAAFAQAASLRAELAASEADANALRRRIAHLEDKLANLDATNIDLVGRLLDAENASRAFKKTRAAKEVGKER